jgi:iron complex outermembrane receptor protein
MKQGKTVCFKGLTLILTLICMMCFLHTPLLYSQEKDLDELLKLSLEELADIQVVTALKKPQGLYEIPAVARVITAAQIRERGYFTLDEALSDLPGFQFRNIMSLNSYVFMRGVPSQNNKILVLVDGIQINELNSGGFYGGGQYNLAAVERIEVVYGPASALYGTNAVSGIINIITKNSRNTKNGAGGRAGLLFGNFNTRYLDVAYRYYNKKKDFEFHISGMYKTTEKADLGGEKGDNNWSENMENFEHDYAFDVRMILKNFTYGITFQNKQTSASTYYRSTGTIYRDTGTYWNICFFNTFLKHRYDISKKWRLSSQVYYRNATVLSDSVLIVTDFSQTGYYRPNNLVGLESMLTFTAHKRFNLTCGVVYENEDLAEGYSNTYSSSPDEKPPRPPKPEMGRNTLLSAYLQGQYVPVKGLQFTAGMRIDNSSVYDQVLTPRLGLVYNRKRLTSKLLYTEAFRAPKPWDYSDGLGNPNLDPEEMESLEIYTAYHFSKHFKAELSLYKNHLHGLLTKEYEGNNWRWINGGKLNTDGLELTLQYARGNVKAYCNYTYNASEYDNAESVPEIAKHSANIGLFYAVTKNVKLDLRGNYLGKRKNVKTITSTAGEYIDAAFVIHSTLSVMNVKKFDFFLVVKNLLDTEYYHTSNRAPDRYRQPQRTIMLKAVYKF